LLAERRLQRGSQVRFFALIRFFLVLSRLIPAFRAVKDSLIEALATTWRQSLAFFTETLQGASG